MKKIPLLPVIFLLCASIGWADNASVRVAQVDYREIGDLLEKVVLSQPENKELGENFRAQRAEAEQAQLRMQEAILSGNKIDPREAASSFVIRSQVKKEVELLCQKYLLSLLERTFGNTYDIVLKSDYGESILYSNIEINDVTIIVRQELLKELPETGNQPQ